MAGTTSPRPHSSSAPATSGSPTTGLADSFWATSSRVGRPTALSTRTRKYIGTAAGEVKPASARVLASRERFFSSPPAAVFDCSQPRNGVLGLESLSRPPSAPAVNAGAAARSRIRRLRAAPASTWRKTTRAMAPTARKTPICRAMENMGSMARPQYLKVTIRRIISWPMR